MEHASERFSAYYSLWGGHLTPRRSGTDARNGGTFPARSHGPAGLSRELDRAPRFWLHLLSIRRFAGAHQHFQKTIQLYDQARHAGFADRFGQDSPGKADSGPSASPAFE